MALTTLTGNSGYYKGFDYCQGLWTNCSEVVPRKPSKGKWTQKISE